MQILVASKATLGLLLGPKTGRKDRSFRIPSSTPLSPRCGEAVQCQEPWPYHLPSLLEDWHIKAMDKYPFQINR